MTQVMTLVWPHQRQTQKNKEAIFLTKQTLSDEIEKKNQYKKQCKTKKNSN